jgi:hypothetical protein
LSAPDNEETHDKIANRILDALQDAINAGELEGSSMVTSFVCVVETLRSDGESGLSMVFSDKRQTVLLGLLNWAHMWCGRAFGGPFPDS